jgi:hypothetical protein
MLPRIRKFVFVLALGAVALLAFAATSDLLPHQHDNASERVCPLCHPPVAGLQPIGLKLPALSDLSWTVTISDYLSVPASSNRRASSRAPPAA